MSRTNAANGGTRLPVGQVAELVYMDAVTHVVGTALRLYLFGRVLPPSLRLTERVADRVRTCE